MSHNSSMWTDDDGFEVITCSCGWSCEGLPDTETAVDVYGEHCYEQGLAVGSGYDYTR